MNQRTLRVLEYPKIIERVVELASSTRGKELAAELAPLEHLSEIKEAQQVTTEALRLLLESDRIPLGGIHDIRTALKKASLDGILIPEELLEVASTLRASRLMRDFLKEKEASCEILPEWGGRLASYPALERELERCLGPNGEILDQASPKLHSLRSQIKIQQNRIREKLEGLIHSSENAKYLQDPIVTVRNERYVIPVKQEYRSLFPGIVHDQSASGATLFIEPMAVVEINNQLRIVESQEVEEVERILRELSGRIKEIGAILATSTRILARLDLAFAKGNYSLKIHGAEPEFNTEGFIELYQARHPLLTGKVVPININLGKTFDTLVITGPNTGGKTVTLKTVGLLALMAQTGLQIPAGSGSSLPLFKEIFCDIGDEQSIEQSLSTFSSHMTQIVQIIAAARTPDCLVLLDELGAGTDPAEGAALAMSILTHLHQLGVRTVATTHYSELKAFAYQTPGIQNAAVEFDIGTLRPTYHLQIGLPGSSQAFEIAQKLGLPEPLLGQARNYISVESQQVDQMLRQIETDRKQASEDQRLSEEARIKGESYQRQYETELEKLKREKAELVRQAREEATKVLIETRRESENLLRRLREASYEELPGIVNEAREKINKDLRLLEERQTSPEEATLEAGVLKPGISVRALSLDQIGTVVEVGNDAAVVRMGIMKVELPFNDLELAEVKPVKVTRTNKTGESGLEAAKNITTEISLRGMTVDEGLYQLEKYLDQAILAGLNRFRVIHGKGTGALRQAVQDYLRANPYVETAYFAEQNEGGLGATVVELKKS